MRRLANHIHESSTEGWTAAARGYIKYASIDYCLPFILEEKEGERHIHYGANQWLSAIEGHILPDCLRLRERIDPLFGFPARRGRIFYGRAAGKNLYAGIFVDPAHRWVQKPEYGDFVLKTS